MTTRKMNRTQRAAINRIIRFYRNNNRDGVTSVRAKVEPTDYGTFWVSIDTRRSDCSQYSPRAVYCAQSAFISVGKRGRIVVASCRDGLRDDAAWVAKSLRGHTSKH